MAATSASGNNVTINLGSNLSVLRNVSAATLMTWCRPDDVQGATFGGVSQNTSAIRRATIGTDGSGSLRFLGHASDGTAAVTVTSNGTDVQRGMWNHVAAVVSYVNNSVTFYLNGVLNGTPRTAALGGTNTSNTNSAAGALFAAPNVTNFYGATAMEDFRIYSRILGPNEIETIYTSMGQDDILADYRFPLIDAAEGVNYSTSGIIVLNTGTKAFETATSSFNNLNGPAGISGVNNMRPNRDHRPLNILRR